MKKAKEYLKIAIAAICIGMTSGLITTVFGKGLLLISAFRTQYLPYLLPFLPVAGLVIVFLYQKFGGKAIKGMGQIFLVGQEEDNDIPLVLVPLAMVTTWLTHLFGGSAGREGVGVQLGATIAHHLSRLFSLKSTSRFAITIGIAAGFSGLFQTPLAAIFFAMEVLVVGKWYLKALLPTMVASFTAAWTSHRLSLEKFYHPISLELQLEPSLLFQLAVLGLIFGLVGNGFAVILSYSKSKLGGSFKNPYLKIFGVGIVLALLLWVAHQGRYSGLGTNLIELSFSGGTITGYDWLLKLLLTVLTIAIGFQGGEVTPLFAIGSSLGVALTIWLDLPVELLAACGYIGVFAAATNTFLAPMFIGGEVFGFENVPYFFVVSAFAYMVNQKASIYAKQKLAKT
ncbi:chloride channel protein [Streptococcus plurextorum]|uniref:chloride channel protein n=1 Tax=Streptococcus plurextorum TaxID=456876 RepID=UPI00040462CF|nr:chloride channel protein [Streptococcus plurextorum]